MPLLAALVGAVLGGVMMVVFYLLSVFVIGAALGGALGALLTLHADHDVRALVVSILAAAGGLLAVTVRRFIVITATSFNGAALVVGGLWMLYARLTPDEACRQCQAGLGTLGQLLAAAWLALGCLGVLIQLSAVSDQPSASGRKPSAVGSQPPASAGSKSPPPDGRG